MYRILSLAAASLAALLAFSACTSQAVLNDLTTDKGYTLTADVPYDREHHLTLDVYSPHNVQNAPVVVFFFGRRWQQGEIGRAAWREGVCQYVWVAGDAETLKK